MAGMLPGVECARRRRFHQGGSWAESQGIAGNTRTRRPSFCLYTSSHETHLVSISSKTIIWVERERDPEDWLCNLAAKMTERRKNRNECS
uniref:Uncharacterized protein n=1 Tax=Nelumbo nucifera TaxID=4432 RepID=A0A822Y7M4_NELNU|nr:TPA_asm: hypothetical protein HUJ06_028787 [Nelumbo nucifera]